MFNHKTIPSRAFKGLFMIIGGHPCIVKEILCSKTMRMFPLEFHFKGDNMVKQNVHLHYVLNDRMIMDCYYPDKEMVHYVF